MSLPREEGWCMVSLTKTYLRYTTRQIRRVNSKLVWYTTIICSFLSINSIPVEVQDDVEEKWRTISPMLMVDTI